MRSVILTVLCLTVSIINAQNDEGSFDAPVPCAGVCPDITYEHYFAKGCSPMFDDAEDPCCPVSFDCSSAEAERSPDKCYYNGVAYENQASMPIANPCEVHCRCDTRSGWGRAECANVECPSLFNPLWFECKTKRITIDQCCADYSDCPPSLEGVEFEETTIISTRNDDVVQEETTVIPPEKITCDFDGKVYNEGDSIDASYAPCRHCVCSEEFTGDIYGPSCRQIECGMDYRNRRQLETGCTPIYFDKRCCQIDWICPGSDRLIPTPEQTATGSELPSTHCTLGEIVAPKNDTLETTADNLRCFCSTPPEFTCIQYAGAIEAQAAEAANKRNVI